MPRSANTPGNRKDRSKASKPIVAHFGEKVRIKKGVWMSSRMVNLTNLTKIIRETNKFELRDKFYKQILVYASSSLYVSNLTVPSTRFYEQDMFKTFLEDINLLYFKPIEFHEALRLEYLMLRINHPLDFRSARIEDPECEALLQETFSEEYLMEINSAKEEASMEANNTFAMCHYVNTIFNSQLDKETTSTLLRILRGQYRRNVKQASEPDQYLYDEEIEIRKNLLQLELISNQGFPDLQAYSQTELAVLEQLQQLNRQNRYAIKKLKKKVIQEEITGKKCITSQATIGILQLCQSTNQPSPISNHIANTVISQLSYLTPTQLRDVNMRKVYDVSCMEQVLLSIIKRLKLSQVADSMEKVHYISEDKLFHVTFQHGLCPPSAILTEESFSELNRLREESMLTSYLCAMKSPFSYISHNIYTFNQISRSHFAYDRITNNNSTIMQKIMAVPQELYSQHYEYSFYICHSCRTLCHETFLRKCRRRRWIQSTNEDDEEEFKDDSDSLYIEGNPKKYAFACDKRFCLSCIKNMYNGKVFNESGHCQACLHTCQCSLCLREKTITKLMSFYEQVGGSLSIIKNQKEIVSQMQVIGEKSQGGSSKDKTQQDDVKNTYEQLISEGLSNGVPIGIIHEGLLRQKELASLVLERERVKLKQINSSELLFNEKLRGTLGDFFFDSTYLQKHEQVRSERGQTKSPASCLALSMVSEAGKTPLIKHKQIGKMYHLRRKSQPLPPRRLNTSKKLNTEFVYWGQKLQINEGDSSFLGNL